MEDGGLRKGKALHQNGGDLVPAPILQLPEQSHTHLLTLQKTTCKKGHLGVVIYRGSRSSVSFSVPLQPWEGVLTFVP